MVRGAASFTPLSMRLGVRYLVRHGWHKEAAIRLALPLEDSRVFELPDALRALEPRPGMRILDLASPKLLAARLATLGVQVTSVDELAAEVELWQRMAGHLGVDFRVADGTALPFAENSFDAAYSVSVLEHIPGQGDRAAVAELARVVRPGGRIVLTLPYSETFREHFRKRPQYVDHGERSVDHGERNGAYFFAREYDDARLAWLVGSPPPLRQVRRHTARFAPSIAYDLFARGFPLTLPLGPLLPLILAREPEQGPGGVVVLVLERCGA